jgi:hypothetical protein
MDKQFISEARRLSGLPVLTEAKYKDDQQCSTLIYDFILDALKEGFEEVEILGTHLFTPTGIFRVRGPKIKGKLTDAVRGLDLKLLWDNEGIRIDMRDQRGKPIGNAPSASWGIWELLGSNQRMLVQELYMLYVTFDKNPQFDALRT